MKVLVLYYCDNGYTCSCCGRDWTEAVEYDFDDNLNAEEFKAKIDEMNTEVKEIYKIDKYGRKEIESAHVVIHSYEL